MKIREAKSKCEKGDELVLKALRKTSWFHTHQRRNIEIPVLSFVDPR